MKILHTSDWHIGKKLENYSRLKEQILVLNEICNIAQKEEVDAVIIAGDLFDTFNPSTDAVELFYKTLKKLTRDGTIPVVAISGNHDSPDRVETADPLARECGIVFLGYPNSIVTPFLLESGLKVTHSDQGFIEFKIPSINYPFRLITTPYANEYRLKQALDINDKETELRNILKNKWDYTAKKYCDNAGVNILATHLFVINKGDTSLEEPEDEKPILHVGGAQAIYTENFPNEVQYVALGHLHRKQIISTSKHPVVYAGSPISYSFSEANQNKYVIIVDVEPEKEAKIKAIELKQGKKLVRLLANDLLDAEQKLLANKESLVELTIITDEYLSAKDRQHLNKLHDGIVVLIPQLRSSSQNNTSIQEIDLRKDLKSLFKDYFKHSNGQEPNESILSLLDEIIAQKDQET